MLLIRPVRDEQNVDTFSKRPKDFAVEFPCTFGTFGPFRILEEDLVVRFTCHVAVVCDPESASTEIWTVSVERCAISEF